MRHRPPVKVLTDGAELSPQSACPRCRSAATWAEVHPAGRGFDSVRLHCRACGLVVKQDRPASASMDQGWCPKAC